MPKGMPGFSSASMRGRNAVRIGQRQHRDALVDQGGELLAAGPAADAALRRVAGMDAARLSGELITDSEPERGSPAREK